MRLSLLTLPFLMCLQKVEDVRIKAALGGGGFLDQGDVEFGFLKAKLNGYLCAHAGEGRDSIAKIPNVKCSVRGIKVVSPAYI